MENTIDSDIDAIRDRFKDALKKIRAERETNLYVASVEKAAHRRRLCLSFFADWYGSLSKRSQTVFRFAVDTPWDGDALSRMSQWDLRMARGCGKTSFREIIDTLRQRGVEVPEFNRGAVMVFVDQEAGGQA